MYSILKYIESFTRVVMDSRRNCIEKKEHSKDVLYTVEIGTAAWHASVCLHVHSSTRNSTLKARITVDEKTSYCHDYRLFTIMSEHPRQIRAIRSFQVCMVILNAD